MKTIHPIYPDYCAIDGMSGMWQDPITALDWARMHYSTAYALINGQRVDLATHYGALNQKKYVGSLGTCLRYLDDNGVEYIKIGNKYITTPAAMVAAVIK